MKHMYKYEIICVDINLDRLVYNMCIPEKNINNVARWFQDFLGHLPITITRED